MTDDEITAEDALDGLVNASSYADDIGEEELARITARCYQRMGSAVIRNKDN